MRRVFGSNEETIRAWLDGNGEVRNSNGSIQADGNYLYSYGSHFILAVKARHIKGNEIIIVNGDNYSVTTDGHRNVLIHIIDEWLPYITISFSAVYNVIERFEGYIEWGERINWERMIVLDHTLPQKEWIKVIEEAEGVKVLYYEKGSNPTNREYITGTALMDVVKKIVNDKRKQYSEVRYGTSYLSDMVSGYCDIYCHTAETVLLRYKGLTILAGFDDRSYFSTVISEPAETVKQAYDALKPDMVKQAEAEGKEVKRQGEWFFIKVANSPKELGLKDKDFRVKELPYLQGQSPHLCRIAYSTDGNIYCTGRVRHEGGDHSPLWLEGIFLPVRNNQVISATSSYKVD